MKWSAEAKVGAFTLAGLLIFAVIIGELSHMVLFGKDGFHVTGYFREAEGIEPGNPIRYAGVEVGRVDSIAVEKGEAVLSLRFYDGSEVPKDADFSIQTSSVMGGRYVRVSGGRMDKGILEDGMNVHGAAAPGFDAAMSKMDKLADSAQKLLDGMNAIAADRASQDHMKETLANVDAITKNVALMTAQMNAVLEGINRDGAAGDRVRSMLDDMAVTAENAKELSFKARSLSDRMSGGLRLSGEGELLYNTKSKDWSPNVNLRFGEDSFVQFGVESIGEDDKWNAQYGISEGPAEYYGGLIRGKVGAGAAYKEDKWKIGAEIYNPNDFTVRVKGGYEVYPDVYATLSTIQPEKREGGGTYVGLSYNY